MYLHHTCTNKQRQQILCARWSGQLATLNMYMYAGRSVLQTEQTPSYLQITEYMTRHYIKPVITLTYFVIALELSATTK